MLLILLNIIVIGVKISKLKIQFTILTDYYFFFICKIDFLNICLITCILSLNVGLNENLSF